jgi:hypothetical protein
MFGPIALGPIAAVAPPGSVTVAGSGLITAPGAVVSGGTLALKFIVTPRPPVSLKDVSRASTDDVSAAGWATVLQVAEYLVPQRGSLPPLTVSACYIVSRIVATSVTGAALDIAVRVINLQTSEVRMIFPRITVPATGFLDLPLKSAVLSGQEVLQVSALNGAEAHVTASYVNSTREQFEVLP